MGPIRLVGAVTAFEEVRTEERLQGPVGWQFGFPFMIFQSLMEFGILDVRLPEIVPCRTGTRDLHLLTRWTLQFSESISHLS